MSCSNDGGGAPCAWVQHYQQAQNELLLARYEAQKWKEKFLQEKQRRRKLARSLLDTMALVEENKRSIHLTTSPPSVASTRRSSISSRRPRRSSSTFSDRDQIDSLLSPTLSSFDFDDDDEQEDGDDEEEEEKEEEEEHGEIDSASDSETLPHLTNTSTTTPAATNAVTATSPIANTTTDTRRGSVLRATSHRDVRPTRSSTLGSYDVRRVSAVTNGNHHAGWSRRDVNQTLPPSNLLYRMLYTKSSSRDLWSSQSTKFHSVARSVMFSMQLKKEHVFEHFFVAGLQLTEKERAHAATTRKSGSIAGFYKPRTFYEFPQRPGRLPDQSIADFCFPAGVPVVECKPHQYATLLGAPVSIWSTDAEQLQKHALDPFRSSGYTFRLTGAKGEVLYGFCVTIMSELVTTKASDNDDGDDERAQQRSPRGDWSKRASCPNGSAFGLSEPPHKSYGASPHGKRGGNGVGMTTATPQYLAPVCYCFTSKFPFYKLHFAILRMVIENTMRSNHPPSSVAVRNPDLYEMTLTVESDLGVEFAVCRQPNLTPAADSSSSGSGPQCTLSSVSSGIHKDHLGDASLSEEAPSAPHSQAPGTQTTPTVAPSTTVSHDDTDSHQRRASGLKRSFSSDDITSYSSSTSCVVEKPVVVRMNTPISPRLSAHIQVGDVLEAIDGISTASLSFAEALELIKTAPRPLKLRFHRLRSRKLSEAAHLPLPATTLLAAIHEDGAALLPPTSIDILQRARRLRIGDPGEWSTLRLPEYAVNYQFPKRDAERWSVGVVLRHLTPHNIVKILAHILLEKQVVIMGANSSLVTATCTALLLLLAPFQWQSTYIPQLPSSLLDFLHSPVPFLVGCQPLQSTDEWPDVCFFDIDTNVILAPIADHHVSAMIPHASELGRLFQGAAQRYQRLRGTGKPWHELSDDEDKVITLTMQESQIFLKDICGELTSHSFAHEDGKSFYEQLQQEVTAIVRKSNFEEFLEEFSQTQMFCQYCETALKAEQDQDAQFAHH